MEQPGVGFGGLLRQLRAEAGLTQEELAEAAQVSPRSVSDLERGIHRTARKDTALLLAGALGLDGQARDLFVAAARGHGPVEAVLAARHGTPGAFAAAATRALPRDTAAFTGRQAELAELMGAIGALAADGGVVGIHAIDGMAGIGKTTFAVHAAHRLADSFPDGQFFLPLHAHTRGQQPVESAEALVSLLLTAGVPAARIPPGLEARAARWRDQVAGKKILLVLDDAAGHEQVWPLLPGTAGSLVLVTSRRRLAALEDATVISLDTLSPAEAAMLLARLAARPGLQAGDTAVGEITRLCGYLPLAIGMLAAQLRHHPARTASGLAAELAGARDLLALMHVEDLSVAAAFDLSYADLTAGQRRLFRWLGLVPGPDIDAYAVAALDDVSFDSARCRLDELYDQHLLTEPTPGRYQLHDLLREHARALVAVDDPAECDAATGRLLDYYLHTALAADRLIPAWTTSRDYLPPGNPPACVPDLGTLDQAAAWLDAERPNLEAAAASALAAGRPLHAVQIPAALGDFLRAHGDWDQAAALHRASLAAARQAGDQPGQALALRQLGILGWMAGDLPAAAASLAQAAALYEQVGDPAGQAYALDHLGMAQQKAGDYPASTASRRQALALARRSGDRLAEAVAYGHMGEAQHATGDYQAAAEEMRRSLALMRNLGNRLGEADSLQGLSFILPELGDYPGALASATRALAMFRELGHRPFEASMLENLGQLQLRTGDHAAAAASLRQALALHRDLGGRLGQISALNGLGEVSSRTFATAQARDYHTQALAIARDIGVPAEEARALAGLGQAYMQDAAPGTAATCLRQALAIYQRIADPAAQRIQENLRQMEPS